MGLEGEVVKDSEDQEILELPWLAKSLYTIENQNDVTPWQYGFLSRVSEKILVSRCIDGLYE